MLTDLGNWSRAGARQRRVTRERVRFWAEVRAGEREAEAHSRTGADLDLRARRRGRYPAERSTRP